MELVLHERGVLWISAIILHLLFVIVGMGSAIISDVLFSFFNKDKKIDRKEDSILQILSNTIWIALIVMVITGFILFLDDPVRYGSSPDFLSKISMVLVLVLNGFAFAFYIHPNLRKISFGDTNNCNKLVKVRRISFACGAISITTWLSIFVVALIDKITLSYSEIMGMYGIFIVAAIIISQVADHSVVKATE